MNWKVARVGKTRWVWVLSAALVLVALPGVAQWISCEGPDGVTFRVFDGVIPCSEAKTPQEAARGYLEKTVADGSATLPSELAAALDAEASRVCAIQPERNTLGTLYGIARWGCENGYAYRETCQGYYLEKEVAAEYGYAVVTYVVVSTAAWSTELLDTNTVSGTVRRTSAGDVRLSVLLGLRTRSAATELAPAGYLDTLREQYRGQQRVVYNAIVDYCRGYKDAYCQELSLLGGLVTKASAGTGATPSAPLSVVVVADRHLSTTTALGVSGDATRFLVITGTVVNDRGQPIPNAEVRVPAWNAAVRSGLDGTYRLSSFGSGASISVQRVDIVLQRVTLELAVRSTDATPLVAVAADGASRVQIAVTSRGIRSDSIAVAAPVLGDFERASAGASPLTLDKDGNGTLVYVPPQSLPDESLTEPLVVGTGTAARTIQAAVVPISVRYADSSGVLQTATLSLRICRAPVLLVQSAFGGPAPWAGFAAYARANGIDCAVVGEGVTWEIGNGSLADWAKDIARNLGDLKSAYEKSGVRIGAVDVVAHSAAGLAVRSLLEGANPRQDVGRLILVGAPNHGIAWLDQEVGAAAARWLTAHPTAAADLREGSPFLRGLSSASAPRNADYVNLVGRRSSSLSASRQGSSTVQDDGIVSAASSHLDGVADLRFDGVVHASGLPLQGTPLTESRDVWAKILDLLLGPVPTAAPDALRVELRKGREVEVSPGPLPVWSEAAQLPLALASGTALRTGDNGYAAIVVTRAGDPWGTISVDESSEIVLRASSPDLVRVEVVSGRARFRAYADTSADRNFEVVVHPAARGASWIASQPDLRVVAVEGDFVASRDDASAVYALSGMVIVEYSKAAGFSPARLVEEETGVRMRSGGSVEDATFPARGWWTQGVWRESIPFFYFPIPLLVVSLLAVAAAAVYHVRARRRVPDRSAAPADRSPK